MNDAQPSKIAVLGPGGVGRLLVPLLNGVEHPVLLRRRYRPEQVMAGVIRVESTRTAPGVITHGSPFVQIDLAGATAAPERIDAVAAVLNGAGIQTRVWTRRLPLPGLAEPTRMPLLC